MTDEEFKNLKDGDILVRVKDTGSSPIGYTTVVFTQSYRGVDYKKIKHQNGHIDSVFLIYWDLVSKRPVKKTGFGKFIRSVEDRDKNGVT